MKRAVTYIKTGYTRQYKINMCKIIYKYCIDTLDQLSTSIMFYIIIFYYLFIYLKFFYNIYIF